jgi:hypothetical protein
MLLWRSKQSGLFFSTYHPYMRVDRPLPSPIWEISGPTHARRSAESYLKQRLESAEAKSKTGLPVDPNGSFLLWQTATVTLRKCAL